MTQRRRGRGPVTRAVGTGLAIVVLAGGCSGDGAAPAPSGAPATTAASGPAPSPSQTPAVPAEESRRVRPADLDAGIAVRAVRHLAGDIGPRHATSPAYREAADWVGRRFERLGLEVRRQRVATPAGVSWGVPVGAGTSINVVATPAGFDAERPHFVVGAHLDTVPQAPGAEDNASGVGVLLAVAEALEGRRTRLPVVLVAFGAEEPRGPGDDDHHYGSRAYVAAMSPAEREAVRAMLSLDRVGVGDVLPVGSADDGPDPVAEAVARAARRAGVPTVRDVNRSSDHWSFVRGGLPAARLGSTPYAAYHSPGDVPAVVAPAQLARAGRTVLAWLGSR